MSIDRHGVEEEWTRELSSGQLSSWGSAAGQGQLRAGTAKGAPSCCDPGERLLDAWQGGHSHS